MAALESRSRPQPFDLKLSSSAVTRTSNVALPELQTLRAVGCLLVFAVHSVAVLFPWMLPASVERSATEYLPHSVIGFFILSGLVLALPFAGEDTRKFSVRTFYLQRLFRLYPLYWLSIGFAVALRFAVVHWTGLSPISPWPERFWSVPLTPQMLLQQFSGLYDSARSINPAYWTLAQEIQACLFFPLVIVLVRRTRHWTIGVVAILAMIVAAHYLHSIHVVRTLSYFVMGAYVAKYNQPLKAGVQRLPSSLLWTCFALLIAFLGVAPASALLFRIAFLVFNVSLALLMVAVQAIRPLAWIGTLRPIQRMGGLSYCFYLVHLPILVACVFLLQPRVHSGILTVLVALSLSILVAWTGQRFVEMPLRIWAKHLAGEMGAAGAQPLLNSRESAAS